MTTSRIAVLVVVFCVLASSLAGATPGVVIQETENNSTTVQHENPDATDEEGSQADIRRWLGNRMTSLLGQSAVQLSQGQYEAARQLLGDQYAEYYAKYVDVAGETQGQDGRTAARALNETREEQREYISLLEEYRETYAAYQAAKDAGNDARARELARKLIRLANQLEATNHDLANAYQRVGNVTNANVSQPVHRFESLTTNVTQQQQRVARAEFEPTTLTLRDVSRSGSYATPIQIRGMLRANNSSLPDRVTISITGEPRTVPLSESGTFSISYRPVMQPTGPQNLTVAYLPANTSIFLGSNATARTQIRPTTPTLSVTTSASQIGFGETVRVTGSVSVNTTGVPGVPVRLSLNGTVLGVVRTNESGVYTTSVPLPATISANASQITAEIAAKNRAIAYTTATTAIDVTPTASSLTVSPTVAEDAVVVSGRLTANQQPVPGMEIHVVRNETRVATVSTDSSGQYTARVPKAGAGEEFTIRVVFTGDGTNLEPASASATIRIPSPTQESGLPVMLLALLGLLVLGSVGGLGVWYRRRDTTPEPTEEVSTTEREESQAETAESLEGALLRETVASGIEEGDVRVVYAGVRRALTPHLSGDAPGRTHWEFATAVRAEFDELSEEIGTLARAYERVAYAERELSEGEVREVRQAAERIREWLGEREAFGGEAQRE